MTQRRCTSDRVGLNGRLGSLAIIGMGRALSSLLSLKLMAAFAVTVMLLLTDALAQGALPSEAAPSGAWNLPRPSSQPHPPAGNGAWTIPGVTSRPQSVPAIDCRTLESEFTAAVNEHTANCELQKYRKNIQRCRTINQQITSTGERLLPHTGTCTTWTAAEIRQNLTAARENQQIFTDTLREGTSPRATNGGQQRCRVVSDRCHDCGSSTAPGNACWWYTCNARTICD